MPGLAAFADGDVGDEERCDGVEPPPSGERSGSAANENAQIEEAAKSDDGAEKAEAEEEKASDETAGQENARRSAESYLEMTAFSRSGLIQQLKFEGYSTPDATYAVDAVSPNWNDQAAKAAKSYLEMTAFSRSGLIHQLKFEGYTEQQAVYGVDQTGL